jgi:hypothetical protein
VPESTANAFDPLGSWGRPDWDTPILPAKWLEPIKTWANLGLDFD